MRCPHCRGEIPPGSQFCGVCGNNVTTPPTSGGSSRPRGSDPALSPSLFELPVSPGARRARVGMLLALNLLLAGGGIALFNGYLDKREQAAHASEAGTPSEQANESDSVPPTPVVKPVGDNALKAADAGPSAAPPSDAARASGPAPTPTPAPTPAPKPDTVATRVVDAGPPPRQARRPAPAEPPGEDEGKRVQVLASQISLVVSRHQGQLTRCYQNAAKANGPGQPLEGRIRLQFSIHPDGKARSVGVVSDDTGSRVLSKCLVGLVGSWTFPSSGSDALDFVWPFDFQAPQ
jgi:outer membrane biosynthesis protein TonB